MDPFQVFLIVVAVILGYFSIVFGGSLYVLIFRKSLHLLLPVHEKIRLAKKHS
jgi:hypothetical protein